MRMQSAGSPAIMRSVVSSPQSMDQDQSQEITFASGAAAWIPRAIAVTISSTTASGSRWAQRGQVTLAAKWASPTSPVLRPTWEKQLVWCSEAVIRKAPPRPGTSVNRREEASVNHSRVSGALVQKALVWANQLVALAPRWSGCFSQKGSACGKERGSLK